MVAMPAVDTHSSWCWECLCLSQWRLQSRFDESTPPRTRRPSGVRLWQRPRLAPEPGKPIIKANPGCNFIRGSLVSKALPDDPAPVANDDAFTTNEDTDVIIDFLANDSDPDGDTLIVQSINSVTGGTVVANGDGTYTFSPDPDSNGVGFFSYVIEDGNGQSATADVTITINPVSDAPTAEPVMAMVEEDSLVEIDVINAVDDIDADALSISAVTQPQFGLVTLNDDGTLTYYAPDTNYNGTDSFIATVSDGNGGLP
ncbi:MAG: cadherin-like domain-containing protein [Thermomicrobiales bacterium]